MRNYTGVVGGNTPQTMPLPGQVANSAGGFSFGLDDMGKLTRFLILGTEGGSYYADAQKMTTKSYTTLERLAKDNRLGKQAVAKIVEISKAGRAPKNDPAIFALAVFMKLGTEEVRALAHQAVGDVCRTGTHLFQLAEAVNSLGGWGRSTKRAFSKWYSSKDIDKLGYQIVKYQSREGWSHRDILRLAHVNPDSKNSKFSRLLRYAVGKGTEKNIEFLPEVVQGFELAKNETDEKKIVKLIRKYGLPRECVPTGALNSKDVWSELLTSGEGMPITAMVRNLAKMTSIGLLTEGSDETRFVVKRLLEGNHLSESRIHPMQVLMALKTYASGHGLKGSLSWTPVRKIVDALDEAFYRSFGNVAPTGKRFNISLDISGSMHGGQVAGTPLTPAECAMAMALVTMNVEKDVSLFGFGGHYLPLPISKGMRLDRAVAKIAGMNFGTTDCSLPMVESLRKNEKYDVFCVYTDNETYAGSIHPSKALEKYRSKMGIDAKLVVVGMVVNDFSIADPNDAGMLDVVGFDTATPNLISQFVE